MPRGTLNGVATRHHTFDNNTPGDIPMNLPLPDTMQAVSITGHGGNEVVAIVQFADDRSANDEELAEACREHIADYKVPKAFIRTDHVVRSPAGKADYRWAKAVAAAGS